MSWTDTRVELMKKLWKDGLSAGEIANKLGAVSRCAVLGKVHRLGLSGRAAPSKPASLAPSSAGATRRKPAPVSKDALTWAPGTPGEAPASLPPGRVWLPLPGVLPISILDREDSHCAWPVDLAGAALPHCCGAEVRGARYCEAHLERAYQPPKADAKARAKELQRLVGRYGG